MQGQGMHATITCCLLNMSGLFPQSMLDYFVDWDPAVPRSISILYFQLYTAQCIAWQLSEAK